MLSMDRLQIEMTIPGAAFAEIPAENCLVTWLPGICGVDQKCVAVICYVDKTTGKVIRHVDISKFPGRESMNNKSSTPEFVRFDLKIAYVPGRDFILSWHPGDSHITAISCAKTNPSTADFAPTETAATSTQPPLTLSKPFQPPAKSVVDKRSNLRCRFSALNVKKLTFKLLKGVIGMDMDEMKGKVSLTGSSYNVGTFPIEIGVELDGVTQSLLKWQLTVVKRAK